MWEVDGVVTKLFNSGSLENLNILVLLKILGKGLIV